MAGSGTDEGLTVDSQLRLSNEPLIETCNPFRTSPYDPFPRTLALVMLTRLETLLFNYSLLMRHGLCHFFLKRVTNILERCLGQGLILTLPFQGVDSEHRNSVP